ncbi:MAG: hypothetical protein ACP5IA_14915 [Sediminispirochaetaceae bacterium]
MTKKILILVVLITFAASGAFALNLSLGLNGALYMDDNEYTTWEEKTDAFKEGEGVYYGLMVELLGDQVGLIGNYYASVYDSSFGYEMIDMDLNLGLTYHLLGTTAFFDPFGEIGLGYIFKDYADEDMQDVNGDAPLSGMNYWYAGVGAGINLGSIGVFTKFHYHFKLGAPTAEETFYDIDGNPISVEYSVEEFALKSYKFVLGAKIIF